MADLRLDLSAGDFIMLQVDEMVAEGLLRAEANALRPSYDRYDPERHCPECAADVVGNDPHSPDCAMGEWQDRRERAMADADLHFYGRQEGEMTEAAARGYMNRQSTIYRNGGGTCL